MSDRNEKMKPILDRIPENWGKFLPRDGWDDLLLELDGYLSEIDPNYVILQAKQKFGELRFYTSHSDAFNESSTDEQRKAFQGFILWAEQKATTLPEVDAPVE